MDDARGPPKRIRRNRQSSASSSSSRHTNGVVTSDDLSSPFQALYNPAPNRNESLFENANMGFQRYYNETIGIRFSNPFPSFRQQHHRYEIPTIAMHEILPNPPQDIAILNGEGGNQADPYRGMRLNIEDMSYEELLALGENIGSVNTSLSEETIAALLNTKEYTPKPIVLNLEELPSEDQESDACIICQEEFESKENVGILACEHAFHVGCITQWLLIKNKCPVCKSEALTPAKVE
ncbi:unnamed protein product [Lathyrus oleraceus]